MTTSARLTRLINGAQSFAPLRVNTRYSAHPTTGAGRIMVTAPGLSRSVAFDHKLGGGLAQHTAAVESVFADLAVTIDHIPDPLTGFRFNVYATPCEYPHAVSQSCSSDVVRVAHGSERVLTLCGYHASRLDAAMYSELRAAGVIQ